MKTIDTKKAYKAPMVKVLEVNASRVLCLSETEAKNTEQFVLSSYHYSDYDFE